MEIKPRKDKYMQITDVKIRKTFEGGPMKAVASVTFDNMLAVHDIKLIFANDRYFLTMPNHTLPDGRFRDVVHPINNTFRKELEEAVLEEYNRYIEVDEIVALGKRTDNETKAD